MNCSWLMAVHSKLFFVQKAAGGDLNLWIDGQPYVNASFRSGKRPSRLIVNGEAMHVNYQNGLLDVKYKK